MKSVTRLGTLALLLAGVAPAFAQPGAVVQSTPRTEAVQDLNRNLSRLSRAPTDMEALIGAGMAAYQLGDAQAANGFFTRANLVNPRVGRVKLGLALTALDMKQPREAATYFDEAAQLGEQAAAWLPQRALAYDLTGQQDKAQRDYAAAIRARPGDKELARNYAVSLGISGKLAEAEAVLKPMLFQSDRAAWRSRTMILAMNGRVPEARRIAQSIMPRNLADGMDPYLQRMGALTPAQKAVAVHYGQFPADGLRLAPVTAPAPPPQTAARTDRKSNRRSRKDDDQPATAPASADDSRLLAAMPPPEAQGSPVVQALPPGYRPDGQSRPAAQPVRRAAAPAEEGPDMAVASSARPTRKPPARSARPAPAATASAQADVPVSRTVAGPPAPQSGGPAATAAAPQPGFSVAPVAPAPAAAEPERTLAEIMADVKVPESERARSAAAVDLKEVARAQARKRAAEQAAAKAKAEAEAKAKAEAERKARLKANPSRHWVQVAAGRDLDALAFDLRRLRRTYDALAGLDGWTAEWGATRRLLVGPFPSLEKAKAVQADLRKAGSDGFVWQSEAGEVVTALSRK